ncbi:hypothetical protein [Eggerthella timonensis]|uniref:hypothetical protein n=1 Tax=Eggerthella timonensis TaxID=1871008 RepID=UPI000C78A0AC|nr:hypothetical protein [Eggerthella timonensis]
MKKTAITLALATTLALGTAVPAFAANTAGATGTDGFSSNNATTEVSAIPDASQIAATIPLKVSVVAPMAGGAITAPAATDYKITNNSLFDIYVTEFTPTSKSDWQIVASDPSGAAAGGSRHGDIQATLNTLQLVEATTTSITAAQADDWKAAANAGTLGLALAGKNSQLTSVTADSAEAVMDIVYKISAAKPTA